MVTIIDNIIILDDTHHYSFFTEDYNKTHHLPIIKKIGNILPKDCTAIIPKFTSLKTMEIFEPSRGWENSCECIHMNLTIKHHNVFLTYDFISNDFNRNNYNFTLTFSETKNRHLTQLETFKDIYTKIENMLKSTFNKDKISDLSSEEQIIFLLLMENKL